MMRKILVWCLTLTLLMGLVPGGVLATDEDTEPAYAWEDMDLSEIPDISPEDDPMYWREVNEGASVVEADNAFAADIPKVGATYTKFEDFTTRELRGESLHRGIDVSEWQGTIDWKAVADSGIEFAFVRLGARGWGLPGTLMKDSCYIQNIQGAKANGILVGAYFYTQATSVAEAKEEAAFSMKLLADAGLTLDLPLVYDFEFAYGSSGPTGRLYNAGLTWQEHTDLCHAFNGAVEAGGYESMVYANLSTLRNHLAPSQFDKVWLAHYTTETSYTGAYEYWQCSSKGYVPGIKGYADINFWFKPDGSAVEPPEETPEEDDDWPFEDVAKTDWCYEYIRWTYENSIVNGMSDTTFGPGISAQRAHVITMLYRMAGSPEVSGEAEFTDLTQDYYKNAVKWAVDNGVSNGISDIAFGPELPIRRQDFVTMLYRMMDSPETAGDLSGYDDGADVADYARDAMAWAVENGIIQGYTDNTLLPDNETTRAEVCTILKRYSNLNE